MHHIELRDPTNRARLEGTRAGHAMIEAISFERRGVEKRALLGKTDKSSRDWFLLPGYVQYEKRKNIVGIA